LSQLGICYWCLVRCAKHGKAPAYRWDPNFKPSTARERRERERENAKHPAMHRTMPTTKKHLNKCQYLSISVKS
jgi:hypothetical protein